ncbi:hypothetical protein F4778DRAFT_753038 [Xylariomycetidae sp. FL2044]|nr:hypothetical protein F4778DRAFT_753038 [Xylariomycetidae sp. FL2044]
MCHSIHEHYMHHDVRTPMVCDTYSSSPRVLANPFHTSRHVCEISRSGAAGSDALRSCEYHSCCTRINHVHICDALKALYSSSTEGDEDDDGEWRLEPEECEYFVLEHRHFRAECLGDDETAYPQPVPATWRDDIEELDLEASFSFCHDRSAKSKWLENLFLEAEKLYTLREDTYNRRRVLCDLDVFDEDSTTGRLTAAAAEYDCGRAECRLQEQAAKVAGLLERARNPFESC